MIRIDVTGHLAIQQRVRLLRLPPAKRKRVLTQLGRKVRSLSRQRLRAQSDTAGRVWTPRRGGSRKKMLRGLSKRMVVYSSIDKVDITFNNTVTAKIAKAQQEGLTEIMTREKMQRRFGTPNYDDPASRRQAKLLRQAGYKVRRANANGWKSPSLKWITENMSVGQAGFILRTLSDKASKTRWAVPLPARAFLGASTDDINAMVKTIFDQTVRT